MKVFEILDQDESLKNDLKHNKGKAVAAIIRGAKRKSNGAPSDDNEIKKETNTIMD